MNVLIGFAIGVISMALIMGICAGIASLVFSSIDSLPALYAGIAAGILLVLAIVGYFA